MGGGGGMGRTGLRRRRGWGRRGGAVAKRITRNSINVHTGEPTPENGKKVGHPRRDDFFVSEGHRPYAPGPRSPNAPRVPPRAPELGRRPGSPLLLRQTSPLPPQCPRPSPALSSNVGSGPAPGPGSNIALAPHPPQPPPCPPTRCPPTRPRTVRSSGVCHTTESHGHAFLSYTTIARLRTALGSRHCLDKDTTKERSQLHIERSLRTAQPRALRWVVRLVE